MNLIADFHIHSKYSRATSKSLDLESLYIAAQMKGIAVIGTGDFTHPAWWQEINAKLVPAEEGLFALRPEVATACDAKVPPACRAPVRFMLTTEISNIYKKNGQTRKNHNLIFMPDLETAGRLNQRLDKIGNIRSDGRPILGLDARILLELVLETTAQGYLVPAHIWTPWFSLLGSKSGFDSVDECFEDLSRHIFALETGLSSDPPMNWRVSALDRFTLISNSDAHSPAKLGREANLFATELSYTAMRAAMESADPERFLGTLEFFPEEGKYHVDGHRDCNFRCLPEESRALNDCCPVCAKPLVLGVLHRVTQLADRPDGARAPRARGYSRLIPLEELLAEVFATSAHSKRVAQAYEQLLRRYGAEFDILRTIPREELDRCGIALLGEAISRMRAGRILFEPGYDGEFGTLHIFDSAERETLKGQRAIFTLDSCDAPPPIPAPVTQAVAPPPPPQPVPPAAPFPPSVCALNAEQQRVIDHSAGPLLVVAGPGTGKTRTITERMAALLVAGQAPAHTILAVTFTNKAAQEMRRRLSALVGPGDALPTMATFHGLCRQLLLERGDAAYRGGLIDDEMRAAIMADALQLVAGPGDLSVAAAVAGVVQAKQALLTPADDLSALPAFAGPLAAVYAAYQRLLRMQHLLDFEDLICEAVRLLASDETWRQQLRQRFVHIFVDEFQDINAGQYRLIRLLASAQADICVIGDPDQAIYGFRGSDVRFFSRFSDDYPAPAMVRLSRNYRSTETILAASHQVIQAQPIALAGGSRLRPYSHIEGQRTIAILEAASPRAEAVAIGKRIEALVGGTGFHSIDFGKVGRGKSEHSFADMAVLFRTSDQGRLIAEVLTEAGIPCQTAGRQLQSEQRGVVKLMALLRVLADQGSHVDLNRLIDLTAPGISRETLNGFKRWAYASSLPLSQAMHAAVRLPIPEMSTPRQQRLVALVRLIQTLKTQCAGLTVTEAITRCLVQTTLSDQIPDEPLQLLLAAAAPFGEDLPGFLAGQALQSDTDLYRSEAEKVALMTMHAAKGLEFSIVFVAGCETGLIPYQRPGAAVEDPDEERRLFFVAMTRAKAQLYFSWSRRRTMFGATTDRQLSPFVADIEKHLLLHSAAPAPKA
ncbi:MAG: UvrD-helicase domain-containing protein, partial [Desulfatitalea sp.]